MRLHVKNSAPVSYTHLDVYKRQLPGQISGKLIGNVLFLAVAVYHHQMCIRDRYKDINDKSSFISRLTAGQAEELINGGIIGGGMLPKLNNCTSAIRNGVNRVHILDGRVPHCLLLEIFTNEGVGTAIISDDEEV